jgi:GSCFA family protein
VSDHPYRGLPDYRFWKKSVSDLPPESVDPVVSAPYRIQATERIVTAGSCFAQHVARYLRNAGLNFLITETPHPIVPADLAEKYGYGLFTARYGNIYTAAQLLQLFQRAWGYFTPAEDYWQEADGRYTDPFRPRIQEDRFHTMEEYRADREHHFACVRQAFKELDIFVFTLGLTEAWMSREDGATYPICPGTGGGEFDPARYKFVNFTVAEVTEDMEQFISLLRSVNPRARVILTVSPVPLVATAEDRHVLVSTTYSKSVLRVAADAVARSCPDVTYFPSYEIITGSSSRGAYYADDARTVLESGVAHVMRIFFRHFTELGEGESQPIVQPIRTQPDAHTERMKELVAVACDEEILAES